MLAGMPPMLALHFLKKQEVRVRPFDRFPHAIQDKGPVPQGEALVEIVREDSKSHAVFSK
jgi:hypothetical protein